MSELLNFAAKYSLGESGGVYYGVCEDMYVNLAQANGALTLTLYLNLPKSGQKRTALLAEMREKTARYEGLSVEFDARSQYLINITITDAEGAAEKLTRYLLECDVLLRAYGRELGVLCAECRSEIKEDMKHILRDGAILPLCAPCERPGENGARRPAVNRFNAMRAKRKKGILGALAGALAAALFWAVLVYLGLGSTFVPAIGVAFIVNLGYVRLGGSVDPKRFMVVCAFTIIALILGEVLGELARGFTDYNRLADAMFIIGYDEINGVPITQVLSMSEYLSTYVFGAGYVTNMAYDIFVGALFGALGAYIVTGRRGRHR